MFNELPGFSMENEFSDTERQRDKNQSTKQLNVTKIQIFWDLNTEDHVHRMLMHPTSITILTIQTNI